MEANRQMAPGRLEQVREFVNTLELEHGTEELSSGVALGRWLSDRGLATARMRVGRDDLVRALELREAIRTILFAHGDGAPPPRIAWQTLDQAARRARLELRFADDGGARVEAQAAGVDQALGGLLAIVHGAIDEGTWARLKACQQHTCQWAFYDHSKNRSGSWCKMELCGNRVKARTYRSRQRPARHPRPAAG